MAVSDASGEASTAVPVTVSSRSAVVTSSESYRPACHAPFVSMFLDQHGGVRACCQNIRHVLGNVAVQPLTEIWHGALVRQLRQALELHDYQMGCDTCVQPFADGRSDRAYARQYDAYPIARPDPTWPQLLELSLSNTCNLQCIMCNGDLSSSIRSHREGRPPLAKVYDDAFFDELRAFIPHLQRVNLLGGEPFLASESLRVAELLAEVQADVLLCVTTNGTQWSPRVERILDSTRTDVVVSIDGATRATYEDIRRGARWDVLRRNLGRFQAAAEANRTSVYLVMCLMPQNWREFAELARWADRQGLTLAVNTVYSPASMSILRLPVPELDVVIAGLQAEAAAGGLGRNASVLESELERYRLHRAELVQETDAQRVRDPSASMSDPVPASSVPSTHRAEFDGSHNGPGTENRVDLAIVEPWIAQIAAREVAGAEGWLDLDLDLCIEAVHGEALPGGTTDEFVIGQALDGLATLLESVIGHVEQVDEGLIERFQLDGAGFRSAGSEFAVRSFSAVVAGGRVFAALLAPRFDAAGRHLGSRLFLAEQTAAL